MSSYQKPRVTDTPGDRWLAFKASIRVSPGTRDWLAERLLRRRSRLDSRWRILDPRAQAAIALAYLRTNLTFDELARANGISTTTCWRRVDEAIGLLADRAIRLSDVLRMATKRDWEYLIIDGVNVPTVAFGRKVNRRQIHYSGKHRRHGVNVQTVCAPDGRLLWASAALPGRTVDITAARHHRLGERIGRVFGLMADLGYLGMGYALTGYRRKRGQSQLPPAQRVANRIHASLRCVGERGNAQLKWWRVMATELRCRPNRCTRLVKAVLCVHHLETSPLTS